MKITLDIVAAWIALDVVVLAVWQLAHGRSRRLGARVVASGPATQRIFTVAGDRVAGESIARESVSRGSVVRDTRLRDAPPVLVAAGRG